MSSNDSGPALAIRDVSEATGLSVHTIRYYDRMGLIPRIGRNSAGHRAFVAEHLRWIALIDRLRISGMSIRQIRAYMKLAVSGDATIAQRRQLLHEHEQAVTNRIAELEECLAIVRAKLALYDGSVCDANEVWKLVASARHRRAVSNQLPDERPPNAMM